MSLKNLVTCEICKNIFINPVILPCSNTTCKSHSIDEYKYNCHFCKVEHEVPLDGFPENLMAKNIIDSGLYLTEDEKRMKNRMEESCLKLDELISSYEQRLAEMETKTFDNFTNIKTKIDLKREELKIEIDNYADSLIVKVLVNQKNLNAFIDGIKSNDNQFKNNCLDLKQKFKTEFSSLNIDINKIESFIVKIDANTNEIKAKFNTIESVEQENIKFKFKSSIAKTDIDSIFGNISCLSNQPTTNQKCIDKNLSNNQKLAQKKFADKCVDCNLIEEEEEVEEEEEEEKNEDFGGKIINIIKKIVNYVDETKPKQHDENEENGEDIFKNNILVSCSDDKTIRIWDLDYDFCAKTLKEKGPIESIYGTDTRLITISSKRYLKIWDLKTYNLLKSFKANDDIAQFLFLSDDKFVIAIGKDIYVWNLDENTYYILKDLHKSKITCIEELSENILITGANDNRIKVWNLEKAECIKSFGHSSKINNLLILNKID
jgi:hypothetical protein